MSQADRQKWNDKYAAGFPMPREPAAVLVGLDRFLPRRGRALDVAGGAGRHGIWLAQRGLDVTIADISAPAWHWPATRPPLPESESTRWKPTWSSIRFPPGRGT